MYSPKIRLFAAVALTMVLRAQECVPELDETPPPPLSRKFYSAHRTFSVMIRPQGSNEWKDGLCTAVLLGRGKTRRLMTEARYGPKTVLVSEMGVSVFLGEWENRATGVAIEIYSTTGHRIQSWSAADIVQLVGQSQAQLALKADPDLGWWLSGQPFLSVDESAALLPVANGLVTVRLTDGRLTFAGTAHSR